MTDITLHLGDALTILRKLPAESVQCCVTSPPYWGLRDYGTAVWEGGDSECDHRKMARVSDASTLRNDGRQHSGPYSGEKNVTMSTNPFRDVCGRCGARRVDQQLGLEATPEDYIVAMVEVFAEVRRVLADDGTLFMNLGDSYYQSAPSRGKGGTIQAGCLLTGSSCPHPCGGPAACQNFRNENSIRRQRTSSLLPCSTDHNSGCQDQVDADAFPRGALVSTTPASRGCDADASCREGVPSGHQPTYPTSLSYDFPCGHTAESCFVIRKGVFAQQGQSSHTSCIEVTAGASVGHKGDMVFDWFSCPYYTTESHRLQLKHKDLIGIPWMLAFALRADGWYLRSDIIWSKPNPMPESVTDRPTKAHEYVFLLSKRARYYYDAAAIREPAAASSEARWAQNVDAQQGSTRAHAGGKANGTMKAVGGPRTDKQRGHLRRHTGFNNRWDEAEAAGQSPSTRNKRDVWEIATQPYREAHFATYPEALVTPCILAGCPAGGVVLDPFLGSGTTGAVARRFGRNFVGIELNPEYLEMARKRIAAETLAMADLC